MAKHPIPDAALDADIATIAQKGAGKTYLNRGLVERLLDARRRVVVLDPLNSWWGLKARADGKPGYPVVVIGGPNADLPLDPHAGERLGEYVSAAQISIVIDVSELKRGELIRFANDFLAALYRCNRDPLWLVLEEADVFAPQQPMGDATMLLHQVDQIARRGRARGFRLWSITQRPAKLHKDVLTQTSTLIMLRIRSPQDRTAAEEWIKGNAEAPQAREIVASLASLPVGEGWVWSPDHDLLARIKFPPIRTLDTSATPQAGSDPRPQAKLAQVDLGALREFLGATTTPDPSIASPPAPKEAEMEEREVRGYRRGLAEGEMVGWKKAKVDSAQHMQAVTEQLLKEAGVDPSTNPHDLRQDGTPWAAPPASPPSVDVRRPRAVRPPAGDNPSSGAQRLLDGLAGAPAPRLSWSEVCVLAIMSPTAGYTRAAINELRQRGLISETPDGVALASRTGEEQLLDPSSVVGQWADKVGGAGARILQHLWVVGRTVGPSSMPDVARELGLSATAGYTRAGWKKLRTNNVAREFAGGWDVARVLRDLQEARK